MPLAARGACRMISDLAKVGSPAPRVSANLTTDETAASFPRVLEILNVNSFLGDYTDFWGRNDPDMLEVSDGRPESRARLIPPDR